MWTLVTITEAKVAAQGRIRDQPGDDGQWRRKMRKKLVRRGRLGASIMNPQANGL